MTRCASSLEAARVFVVHLRFERERHRTKSATVATFGQDAGAPCTDAFDKDANIFRSWIVLGTICDINTGRLPSSG